MITIVDNEQDPRLDPFRWRDRQLASRLDRLETIGAGLFVAEGDLVVQRAITSGCIPVALLCDELMGAQFDQQLNDVTIFVGNEDLRGEVTGLGVPLKAVGLFRRPGLVDPAALISSSQRIVVAESLDNPTNLGAIIRSATALGWDGLLLTEGSADPLARRALRVSMGTGLQLPFARHEHAAELHEMLQANNCITVALTPDSRAQDIGAISFPPDQKIALLLGSERDGLSTDVLSRAHHQLRIPMFHNTDSLNVAAAAAVALFALGPRA
jgi:tRNA G18 (ribose-2'-O)-methylase SpoU